MKKKIGAILLVVALALALGLVPAASVGANPTPAIQGLWHFDETMGTTAADSSGNGNDGTLVGDTAWVAGKFGNALSFDGAGDRVEVARDASLEPSNVTVECWVKGSTLKSYQYIVAKYYTGGHASYGLYTGSSKGLFFYVSDGSYALSNDAGTGVWDGNWHHIAGTYNGSTLRLYVDGSEVGTGKSVTKTIGYNSTSAGKLYIGSYGAAYYFTGEIDEVRVWDEALTASQLGDVTAPVGSITINSDATCTNSTGVTLNLAATDAVGVTGYRVADGADASEGTEVTVTSTTNFSDNIAWTLPSGDEPRR